MSSAINIPRPVAPMVPTLFVHADDNGEMLLDVYISDIIKALETFPTSSDTNTPSTSDMMSDEYAFLDDVFDHA